MFGVVQRAVRRKDSPFLRLFCGPNTSYLSCIDCQAKVIYFYTVLYSYCCRCGRVCLFVFVFVCLFLFLHPIADVIFERFLPVPLHRTDKGNRTLTLNTIPTLTLSLTLNLTLNPTVTLDLISDQSVILTLKLRLEGYKSVFYRMLGLRVVQY